MLYDVTLAVAALSMVTTATIMLFYYLYPREHKSRLLTVIVSLIFTDFMVAFLVILWHIMQSLVENDGHKLDLMCRVFLPFPIYFFIAGYGFTVVAAWRFFSVSMHGVGVPSTKDSQVLPLCSPTVRKVVTVLVPIYWQHPLWGVWYVSFILMMPLIILNILGGFHMTEVVDTPISRGSWAGRLVNNICFQLPLLITIAANITAFVLGLRALRYSPHSVVAREMNRVGKYLFVLLIVWLPNLLVNLYQELNGDSGSSSRYDVVIEVMVFLTSLQGFLNAIVYAWGHNKFKKFIRDSLLCFSESSSPSSRYISNEEGINVSTTLSSGVDHVLTEKLCPTASEDYYADDCTSTDSQEAEEREYFAARRERSSRISDASSATAGNGDTSSRSPVPAASTTHAALALGEDLSNMSTPSNTPPKHKGSLSGAASSVSSSSRKRVPPSEKMLRFNPSNEVKYFDDAPA